MDGPGALKITAEQLMSIDGRVPAELKSRAYWREFANRLNFDMAMRWPSALASHDQKVRAEITLENLGAFEDAVCHYQTKEKILDFISKRRKAMESECGTA